MAAKNSKRKGSKKSSRKTPAKKKDQKHYPVQRHLMFEETAGGALAVLQVDRHLSGSNRRLYRQNRVYKVKVDQVGSDARRLDVFRLRDTFMLHRGYELAMREWVDSFRDERALLKDKNVARWMDFRIHTTTQLGDTYQQPVNLEIDYPNHKTKAVVTDDFNQSVSFDPNGQGRGYGLVSNLSQNQYGIIEEYAKMGNVSPSPTDPTVEAAYGELKSDVQDMTLEMLQELGNQPPYDADSLAPECILEYVGTIYKDAGVGKSTTGYFDAPLGAIFLSGNGSNVNGIKAGGDPSNPASLYQVTVQAGDYKGVNARPYVDVPEME